MPKDNETTQRSEFGSYFYFKKNCFEFKCILFNNVKDFLLSIRKDCCVRFKKKNLQSGDFLITYANIYHFCKQILSYAKNSPRLFRVEII